MAKRKTIPELKAELAANERQLTQLQHKKQHVNVNEKVSQALMNF